jgi:hypothetical protein
VNEQEVPHPKMTLAIAMSVLLIALVAIYLAATSRRRPISVRGNLRSELTRKLMGDEQAAARLIELERKRRPGASEKELVRAALQRLEGDRR